MSEYACYSKHFKKKSIHPPLKSRQRARRTGRAGLRHEDLTLPLQRAQAVFWDLYDAGVSESIVAGLSDTKERKISIEEAIEDL
jgi:hypothetical protein